MTLVGDIIQGVRELIPDPAPTLGPPLAASATVVAAAGSTLPAGTYYVKVTQTNPWGESLPFASELGPFTVGAGQGLQIAASLTPGATAIRAYLTSNGAPGSENQFVQSTTGPFIISTPPTNGGIPPTRSTAYNPDLDGQFVSANAIYRWLNRGLAELSRTTGGIRDYAGVQAVNGQPMYVLPGNWIAITDIWYAGYWMQGGQRGNFFRANAIIAQILTSATVSVQDNRTILEVYPQPANTGGSTTLSSPMDNVQTFATVNGPFVSLAFGFIQVDNELMAYSAATDTNVTGLIRGLGGSIPVAHSLGAPVIELNLVINGRRLFANGYSPGSSQLTLPAPPGWADILSDYMMMLARQAEEDEAASQNYLKKFSQKVSEWARSNGNPVKRRQIGPSSVPEAYYGGVSGGGGWIIP